MLVKLQRPPPEMRIFLPGRSACSSTATRRPRLPVSIAHINPAAPAPITIASKRLVGTRSVCHGEGDHPPTAKEAKGGAPSITVSALSRDTCPCEGFSGFAFPFVEGFGVGVAFDFCSSTKARFQNPAVDLLVPPAIYSVTDFRS